MRRFDLTRREDVTGMSGTGRVASGIKLPFRLGAVMRWNTPTWSIVYYPRMEWVVKIHGHDGRTLVTWR